MSKNRANMLTGSNNPSLARVDINDMFADLGYGSSGDISAVTTTGEASKLLKFSSIANTLLHFLRIRKSSTTALNVQDDSSVDVFNVDTTNKVATSYNQKISGLAGTGNRMVVADSSGNLSTAGVNTYTPVLSFYVSQIGSFVQISSGSYVITGNIVKVKFGIDVTGIPIAGSYLTISLPLNRKAGSVLCGYFARYNGINVSATADFIGLSDYAGDLSNAWIIKSKNDGTDVLNCVDRSDINSDFHIQGIIEYEI